MIKIKIDIAGEPDDPDHKPPAHEDADGVIGDTHIDELTRLQLRRLRNKHRPTNIGIKSDDDSGTNDTSL